jgi:hypothetical protein
MQQRFPFTAIHDALYTTACHLRDPLHEQVCLQKAGLIFKVVQSTEYAPVVARAARGYFHINRVDILAIKPACNFSGVKNELVTVDPQFVRH